MSQVLEEPHLLKPYDTEGSLEMPTRSQSESQEEKLLN